MPLTEYSQSWLKVLCSGAEQAGGLLTAVTASLPYFMDLSMVASSPQLLPKFIGVPLAGASLPAFQNPPQFL